MSTPAMQLPESLAKSIARWPPAILYSEAVPRQLGPTINAPLRLTLPRAQVGVSWVA
jgi:hypothetical protein